MKIQTWLKHAREELLKAGVESAALDARILVETTLQKPSEWIIAHDEYQLTASDISVLNKKLVQRIKRVPLAYIIGSKQFYGRTFFVNEHVLIPRPESEAIITMLLNISAAVATNTILDLGTGSGCLAISAQLELPSATVVATDISKEALALAAKNAHQLGAPVQFYRADLLNTPSSIEPTVILANLPYVPDELITSREITHEPALALFSGRDGLDHYKIMWGQLVNFEPKPQYIITESLLEQHADQEKLAHTAGYELQNTDTLIQLFVLAR
jgi:release factor glutamine methyltransferase